MIWIAIHIAMSLVTLLLWAFQGSSFWAFLAGVLLVFTADEISDHKMMKDLDI